MFNSNKRMIELYQERVDGKRHQFRNAHDNQWVDKCGADSFNYNREYRIKPETVEEAAMNCSTSFGYYSTDSKDLVVKSFKAGAKWREENPKEPAPTKPIPINHQDILDAAAKTYKEKGGLSRLSRITDPERCYELAFIEGCWFAQNKLMEDSK